MRRWLLILCLVCLCLPVGSAQGQSAAAPTSPLVAGRPDVQRVGYQTAAPLPAPNLAPAPSSRRTAEPEVLPAVPPASAAPPPDPAPPRWGDYGQPAEVPSIVPPMNYGVVGPPRGILQSFTGQDYRSVVSDPNGLLPMDEQLSQSIDLYRPDGLAPIGVFADHTMPTGRLSFTYRYLQDTYQQNLSGTQRVSDGSVQNNFTYVPARMFQNRQVLSVEYGVTNDLTILATLPFQHTDIDYLQLAGSNIKTAFTNPGDITLNALYVVHRAEGRQSHLGFGVSVPVGMLQTLSDMPSPTIPNLPYVVRTSSGTYDLLPSYTYRGQSDFFTWGVQASGVLRLGLNHFGYRLGDQADVTGWLGCRLTERWAVTGRFDSQWVGNVFRSDARLNPTLAPTNRPDLQAFQRVNLLVGLNYYLPANRVPGQRLSVEFGAPVYQSLDGPQLGLEWVFNAGWTLLW